MLTATFGITKEPFIRGAHTLLSQQQQILDVIKIHSQQGGFSVIIGNPGVGKTILREHIEALNQHRHHIVVSFSRTMHTYLNILKQLAEAFQLDVGVSKIEKEIIQAAYGHIKDRKTLYIVIDEAHLMDLNVLRKLRLLFERFPKKHSLILLGQKDLLFYLSLSVNKDIQTRITFSQTLAPLNDQELHQYILSELDHVGLGHHTFDPAAIELILRSCEGNLRLCRNLCYGALIETCRHNQKIVTIAHVNAMLIQPHWRSHDELIKQQAA